MIRTLFLLCAAGAAAQWGGADGGHAAVTVTGAVTMDMELDTAQAYEDVFQTAVASAAGVDAAAVAARADVRSRTRLDGRRGAAGRLRLAQNSHTKQQLR